MTYLAGVALAGLAETWNRLVRRAGPRCEGLVRYAAPPWSLTSRRAAGWRACRCCGGWHRSTP